MKICFPAMSDQGLNSQVYGHFGSAPVFIIFDSETGAVTTVGNQDLGHTHGMCSPLKALDGAQVDAIVVGGIGAGAILKLNEMGIRVFRAAQGTVKENAGLFAAGSLSELTVEHACGGHSGCSHH